MDNRIHGFLDQAVGFGRELVGEVIGSDNVFAAGLRQRKIGLLEARLDLTHEEAEAKVDELTGEPQREGSRHA